MLTRTDPDAPKHRGISYFMVDMKTPGIEVRPIIDLAGNHVLNETFFTDVRVPADQMLGEENRGWYVAATLLDFERSGIDYAAAARRALDDLAQTAKTIPTDDGKSLSDDPDVRRRFVELATEAEAARLIAYEVAYLQGRGPRDLALVHPCLHDRVEGPGPDDLMRLRAHVHREESCVPVGIDSVVADDLRGEGRGCPGVHDIGVPGEAPRLVPLLLFIPGRCVAQRIQGKSLLAREDRRPMVGLSLRIERIPDGEGHSGVALTAHAPVLVQALDPVLVAAPHIGGMPLDLASLLDQLLLVIEKTDEPLTRRDELEWAVAMM